MYIENLQQQQHNQIPLHYMNHANKHKAVPSNRLLFLDILSMNLPYFYAMQDKWSLFACSPHSLFRNLSQTHHIMSEAGQKW